MFLGRISLGLRSLALVTMPAAAGLVALARPTVGLVLEHGFFESSQADVTSGTLAAFAVGMFTLSAYLFILRGFYAHNDTRTPFVINVFENGLNIVVALILVGPLGVPGAGVVVHRRLLRRRRARPLRAVGEDARRRRPRPSSPASAASPWPPS